MAKAAEIRKKNFFKFCQSLFVIGKKVLVNLLEWFYLGGDTNYFDYIIREYDIFAMEDYLDPERRYTMKYKTPMDLDMKTLYFLLKTSCRLYEARPRDEDAGCSLLEHGIDSLMLRCSHVVQMKHSLTSVELQDRLYEIKKIYVNILTEGGSLSGRKEAEIKKQREEPFIGLVFLDSFIEEFNPDCPALNGLFPYSEEALDKMIREAERTVTLRGKPTMADMTGFCKDIMDEKMFCRLLRKDLCMPKSREQELQDEEKRRIFIQEMEDYKEFVENENNVKSSKNTKTGKTAGSKKTLTAKKKVKGPPGLPGTAETSSSSVDSKGSTEEMKTNGISTQQESCCYQSKESSPCKEMSKGSLKASALKCKDYGVVSPIRTIRRPMPQGVKPSLLCLDNDIVIKEHKKYSRRPGRQVRLNSFFSVEGLNDDDANIIILSGEAGMGKTLLTKYILEKCNDEQNAFDGLESRDFTFYAELNNNQFSSFFELMSHELESILESEGLVAELVMKDVLKMPILIVLDGYCDSCEKSCQLVKEVVQLKGNDVKVIITCRSQYVETVYQYIPKPHKRHVSHLVLNGIPLACRAECVRRLIDFELPTELKLNNGQIEKLKGGLINCLPILNDIMGDDLCNPQMLLILARMWLEMPHI